MVDYTSYLMVIVIAVIYVTLNNIVNKESRVNIKVVGFICDVPNLSEKELDKCDEYILANLRHVDIDYVKWFDKVALERREELGFVT